MDNAESARQRVIGRRYVVATALLWSAGGVITKLIPLPPLAIAFYRSLFAGLALLPLVKPSRWVFRPAMLPGAVIFGAMVGLYIASIKSTTAANAIFLQYSSTFWVIPLGLVFLGEKPDSRSLLGIALATVGVATIVWLGRSGTPGEERGILLGLASGLGYAAIVTEMRGLRDVDPVWLTAVNNLGGALTLGAWIWCTTGSIPVPSAGQSLALVAFGVLQMAIPYVLFARGLQTITAAEAGLISLLEPILNPIWVVLLHGERPAPATILGGMFLLAGVACRYLPWGTRGKPEANPALE